MSLYIIDRTLDYTATQRFAVAADSADQAEERVNDFTESDWSAESARRYGVAQISDHLEQIENSHAVRLVDVIDVQDGRPELQRGLDRALLQENASKMRDLLKQVASNPQMYWGPTAKIGQDISAFLAGMDKQLAEYQSTLDAVVNHPPSIMNRETAATRAFEAYGFGAGVSVEAHGGWDRSDPSDYVKIVYVRYDDDPADEPTHKLSFHVGFHPDSLEIGDVYALDTRTGSVIGECSLVGDHNYAHDTEETTGAPAP